MTSAHSRAVAITKGRPSPRMAQSGELRTILRRIEDAIETETAGIRSDVHFDLAAANSRKSRHLFDLTRAMRGLDAEDLKGEDRDAILRLKSKLERNEVAIKAHMQAVTEIASLVRTAIQQSEADGTYSEAEFGYAAL